MSTINLVHKEMTDEEVYEQQKKLYKYNPKLYMDPEKMKRLIMESNSKKGRVWSK